MQSHDDPEQAHLICCTEMLMECYRKAVFRNNMILADAGRNSRDIAVLRFLEQTMESLHKYHPKGNQVYFTLYYTYVVPGKLTALQLRDRIGGKVVGHAISRTTVYRWKKYALQELGMVIWRQNPRRLDNLAEFINRYLGTAPDVGRIARFFGGPFVSFV